MPNWAFLLTRLVLGLAASALMTFGGFKLGGFTFALIGFVFSTPLIAVAIAKPLVEMIEEGFGWLSAQPLKKWQGNYYEFGGVQVRVFEDEDELWFAADDVIKATGISAVGGALPDSRLIEEIRLSCLTLGGVEALLARHRSHEAGRFLLWARREVLVPWERKRSGALVPR